MNRKYVLDIVEAALRLLFAIRKSLKNRQN